MALYFFDTDDGRTTLQDSVGLELADDRAALEAAAQGLADLSREFILAAGDQSADRISISVRTSDGVPLRQLTFSFSIALPA